MFSVEHLIQSGGLVVIALIIFAEGGLLAGFFLPGDTLLLTAGYFAAIHKLPLGWLLLVVVSAAIIGDNVGFLIGKHAGPKLFRKKEGFFFHPDQLKKAESFYEKHGTKTVLLARFVPVVRTFAPVVAGASKMPHKRFAIYNAIGATLWGVSITLLGYILGHWIGSKVAHLDKYIMIMVVIAICISFGPAMYHLFNEPSNRAKIKQRWHDAFDRSAKKPKE